MITQNRAEICSTDRNIFNRLSCEWRIIYYSLFWNTRFKQGTPFRKSSPRISQHEAQISLPITSAYACTYTSAVLLLYYFIFVYSVTTSFSITFILHLFYILLKIHRCVCKYSFRNDILCTKTAHIQGQFRHTFHRLSALAHQISQRRTKR